MTSMIVKGSGKINRSVIENRRTELLIYLQCEAESAAMRHKGKLFFRYVRWLQSVRSANHATIAQWHSEYMQALESVEITTNTPEPITAQSTQPTAQLQLF